MPPNLETITRIAEDVAAGHLTSLDGTRSPLGRRIAALWGRQDFEMTLNWVLVSQDWICPGCGRGKLEMSRLDQDRRILAKIVEHHDHMIEAPYDLFQAGFAGDRQSSAYDIGVRASWRIGKQLLSFDDTLVCEDCNNVDARAAQKLGAPKKFSFSPAQIRRFIQPLAHQWHRIDLEKLQIVWQEVEPLHAQRVNVMNALIAGLLRGELQPDEARHPMDGARDSKSARSGPPPYWNESSDGEWSSLETQLALGRALDVPSDAALERWRTVQPSMAKVPPAGAVPKSFGVNAGLCKQIPADWCCPICRRRKERTYFLDDKGNVRFELDLYWRRDEKHPIPACVDCVQIFNAAKREIVARLRIAWSDAGDLISAEQLRAMIIPQDYGRPAVRADVARKLLDAIVAAGPPVIKARQQSFDF